MTENLNLNFIYKNANDNDVYDFIYIGLGYILLYAMFLQIELFRKADLDAERAFQWYYLIGFGSYNSIFGKGRCPILRSVNHMMRDFLICPHCGSSLSIKKAAAARFFMAQKLHCGSCNRDHDFPLYWLMSKTKWSIADDGSGPRVSEAVV